MVNDEMMNRINIQTSIIKLKFSAFSDAFFQELNFGPLLSLSFSSNNDQQLTTENENTHHNCAYSNWHSQQLFLNRNYLEENFPNVLIKFFPAF